MTLYMENVADQTDHFTDAFVREKVVMVWRCDDIMMVESLKPTPFCLEKSSVRKWTI